MKQEDLKILVIGLENAGKTSFLLSLSNKYDQLYSEKARAKVGFDRREYSTLGFPVVLFDFDQYHERRFYKELVKDLDAGLIYFIFDVLDRHNFGRNVEIFENILKILIHFKVNPEIIVCFHKCDQVFLKPNSFIHENLKIAHRLVRTRTKRKLKFFQTSSHDYISLIRAFCAGISKIMPESAQVMETIFDDFRDKSGADIVCLLDQDALVIYESTGHEKLIREIIEVISPNIVAMAEKLISYKLDFPKTIQLKLKGWFFFKSIRKEEDRRYYLIVYAKNPENFDKVNGLLPIFAKTISNAFESIKSPELYGLSQLAEI